MAMEFTKCIGELLKKNGVVPKMTEYTGDFETENTFETRYGVTIDELDFSEHDKVFADKIKKLNEKYLHIIKTAEKHQDARMVYEKECEKLKQRIAELEEKNKNLVDMINELQLEKAHIDCDLYDANKRIDELESKETFELPFDPLECANYLINAACENSVSCLRFDCKGLTAKFNSSIYTVKDLEQIAEHLLVYCKHNKESE